MWVNNLSFLSCLFALEIPPLPAYPSSLSRVSPESLIRPGPAKKNGERERGEVF